MLCADASYYLALDRTGEAQDTGPPLTGCQVSSTTRRRVACEGVTTGIGWRGEFGGVVSPVLCGRTEVNPVHRFPPQR